MPAPRKSSERLQAAMLLATGMSGQATADAVGVSVGSIYDWLREPEFAEQVRLMTDAVKAAALQQLNSAGALAADVLVQALTRPPEWRDRIRAADLILSRIGIEVGASLTVKGAERSPLAERIAKRLGLADEAPDAANRDEEPEGAG